MENSNGAEYTAELEYIVQLITALEYIVSVLEEKPIRYPLFIADVNTLLLGRCVEVGDEHYLINGLNEQIDELYDTMAMLEAEVAYELGEEDGQEM